MRAFAISVLSLGFFGLIGIAQAGTHDLRIEAKARIDHEFSEMQSKLQAKSDIKDAKKLKAEKEKTMLWLDHASDAEVTTLFESRSGYEPRVGWAGQVYGCAGHLYEFTCKAYANASYYCCGSQVPYIGLMLLTVPVDTILLPIRFLKKVL